MSAWRTGSRLAAGLLAAGLATTACAAGPAPRPASESLAVAHALSVQPGTRPESGAVLTTRKPYGSAELVVDNGTDTDAVVTLSWQGFAFRAVYVRARGSAALRDVADGVYDVFVTQGNRWGRDRFVFPTAYRRLTDTATLVAGSPSTLTLRPAPDGGGSGGAPVDPSSYPR